MSFFLILQSSLIATAYAAALNPSTINLNGWLPQSLTNGGSLLGTLQAPNLPSFLDNAPGWGSRTAHNTNPYTQSPTTGRVRSYDFTIKRGTISPDGYQKDVMLINGQFPGPTIEANWGDTIQVNVHNDITGPDEGTALHWHGLLQTGTPWEDGVPAVSQCPIPPGKSLQYSFKADLYGTSWYHSHYSAQYAGGLFGPMIIYGPKNVDYDIDLGPVMLTDYYHRQYYDLVEDVMGTNPALFTPKSDNNLINGKMEFNCSLVTDGTPCKNNAGLSKFKFTPGKKHRLRLINAGAEGLQKFSIDNHTLTVMANDFVPIQPYQTNIVTLGIGQRTDVIVEANGAVNESYWMRSTISCSFSNQPNALAIISYPNAPQNTKPTSTAWTDTTKPCANDPLTSTTPFFPISPSPSPATTIPLTIGSALNATGHHIWTINTSSYRGDYNSPTLLLAKTGNTTYPTHPEWNVYNTGSNHTIRLVVENPTPASHPMHLHGHNMFVLAEGVGTWDGSVSSGSGGNVQRRDVQLLQPNGYLVVQIDADNPGVWPFHCHIAWHVSAGLYVNIMERPADITKYNIPQTWAQTCRDWATFTVQEVVDQIDSGL